MLFPAEDQSKLDKRSLINLPIPLGREQIGNCSLWLSKGEESWCIDLVWLMERPPHQSDAEQRPGPGRPSCRHAKCPPPHPNPAPLALSQEEGKHLIRQAVCLTGPQEAMRREL